MPCILPVASEQEFPRALPVMTETFALSFPETALRQATKTYEYRSFSVIRRWKKTTMPICGYGFSSGNNRKKESLCA